MSRITDNGLADLLGTSEFLHALAAALISTSQLKASPEWRSPLTLAWLDSAMLSCCASFHTFSHSFFNLQHLVMPRVYDVYLLVVGFSLARCLLQCLLTLLVEPAAICHIICFKSIHWRSIVDVWSQPCPTAVFHSVFLLSCLNLQHLIVSFVSVTYTGVHQQ